MGYTRYNYLLNQLYRKLKTILLSSIIFALLAGVFSFYQLSKKNSLSYGYYGSYHMQLLSMPFQQDNIVSVNREVTKSVANSLKTSYFKMGLLHSLTPEVRKTVHFNDLSEIIEIAISENMFDVQVVTNNENTTKEIRDYIRNYLFNTEQYSHMRIKLTENIVHNMSPVINGKFYENAQRVIRATQMKNLLKNVLMGAVSGAAFVIFMILVRVRLHQKVKGVGDVKEHTTIEHVLRVSVDSHPQLIKNIVDASEKEVIFLSTQPLSHQARELFSTYTLVENVFQHSFIANEMVNQRFVLLVEEEKTSYENLQKHADYFQQLGIVIKDAIVVAQGEAKGLPC